MGVHWMVGQHFHNDSALRFLLVEDNPEDREMYRRILKRQDADFQIFEAVNVNEGLKMVQQHDMDCILLDYRLPDGDGMSFLHSLQKERMFRHAAIVMVTGNGDEHTAAEAMKMGVLDYITKDSILKGFFMHSIFNAIERARLKEEVLNYQRELVRSNAALSEFTHMASHDLKAPLRHIISYCNILEEDLADTASADSRRNLQRLIVNADRLKNLVDDLLIHSEVMGAKEKAEPVNCNALMAEVLEDHEEAIRESGASVTVRKLPVILAIPLRMKQLLQNIFTNALKYRVKGRVPMVNVECEDREKEYVFSISDNGCGIEEKNLETVFRAFKRLHSRDDIEGSGLGLAICRKVVALHGGRIWVESTPGEGSSFFFSIPKKGNLVPAKRADRTSAV